MSAVRPDRLTIFKSFISRDYEYRFVVPNDIGDQVVPCHNANNSGEPRLSSGDRLVGDVAFSAPNSQRQASAWS